MKHTRILDPDYFKSGNSVPVERVSLTRVQYEDLLDIEDSLDQAVDLAEYVQAHAKGKMEDAAAHFLSYPYGQFVRRRALAMQRLYDNCKALRHAQRAYMDARNDPEVPPEEKERLGQEVARTAQETDEALHAYQLLKVL